MIFDIFYNRLFRERENVLILSYFPPKCTTNIFFLLNISIYLLSLDYSLTGIKPIGFRFLLSFWKILENYIFRLSIIHLIILVIDIFELQLMRLLLVDKKIQKKKKKKIGNNRRDDLKRITI